MLLFTAAAKSLPAVTAGVVRIAGSAVTTIGGVVRALLHRREIMRLGELDERGLKDIGLVRSDIDGALATSWLTDPSKILAARSDASAGLAERRRRQAVRLSQTAPLPMSDAGRILARCV